MADSIFKNTKESFSEGDQKDFGKNELTNRLEDRDSKITMGSTLTIVYAIISVIISSFAPQFLPIPQANLQTIAIDFLGAMVISIIFVVAYFIVKCIYSHYIIEPAAKFAEDFIDYFSLPQRERLKIDSQKRQKKKH